MSSNKSKQLFHRGSKWVKCDLHMHTPGSHDWKGDSNTTHQQFYDTCKGISLELIAITDHNTVEWIKSAQHIFHDSEITLLPGVELKTDKGKKGVHMIGVFPEDTDPSVIEDKVLTPLALSKTHLIENGASELQITKTPAQMSQDERDRCYKEGKKISNCNFENASTFIRNCGGLVIIHDDKSSGLGDIDSVAQSFPKKVLVRNFVDIFEVSGERQRQANLTKIANNIKKSLPSITASDSHHLDQIGSKPCWIKGSATFEGLKQILYEPSLRIYLGKQPPSYLHRQITKINIVNASKSPSYCLDDPLRVDLNPNLNVFIGGRGSGKTTLLELASFVVGLNSKKGKQDKAPIVDVIINEMAQDESEVKMNFSYGENLIESKRKLDHSSEPDNQGINLTYWPQGQIEKAADTAEQVRKLAEPLLNTTEVQGLYDQLGQEIDAARSISRSFEAYDGLVERLSENEESIKNNSIVLKTVQSSEFSDLIGRMTEFRTHSDIIVNALEALSAFMKLIKQAKDDVDAEKETYDVDWEYISKQIKLETTFDLGDIVEDELIILNDKITEIYKTIEESDWKKETETGLSATQKEYAEKCQQLGVQLTEENISEASKALSELKIEKARLLKQIERIEASIDKHSKLTEKAKKFNRSIVEKHAELYSSLASSLTPHKTEIEIEDQVEFPELDIIELFRQLADRPKLQVQDMVKELLRHENLDKIIESLESTTIPNSLKGYFPETIKWFFADKGFKNRQLLCMRLREILPEYKPVIKQQGKALDQLSFGERCALVLKIILETGEGPLLIDQPEDHLDNEFIWDELRPMLREKKLNRQIILVTHNPNIVVNADAEQIIVFKRKPTDSKCFEVHSGGLENKDIRKMVTDVLEGGEEAFRKRERRYELIKKPV